MHADDLVLLGVGDIMVEREQPETMFRHVAGVLRAADITFANSEQMFSDKGHPSPIHTTTSSPRNIPALVAAGFDVLSLANNHTLDWGPEGLLDTLERLSGTNLAVVGAGPTLADARRPVILERKGQRVGFLAYSCTGPEGYEARADAPGYAPMRAWTVYHRVDYQPGTPPKVVSLPHLEDLAAMEEDIGALKERCDVVVVSFHWGQHFVPRVIPDYCFTVGRAAVDAGADLILGTHPHILKGIEVHKGAAIFYSTSNFAFERLPGTPRHHRLGAPARELYDVELDPDYPTYPFHRDAKWSLIAKAVIRGGRIRRVSYLPVHINRDAEPEIVGAADPRGVEVFDYVGDITTGVGLRAGFSWDGDEVLVTDAT